MFCVRRLGFSLLFSVGTLLGAAPSGAAIYASDAGAYHPSASFADLLAQDGTAAAEDVAQAALAWQSNPTRTIQWPVAEEEGTWSWPVASAAGWQDNAAEFGDRHWQWDDGNRAVRPHHGGGWEGGSEWGSLHGYDGFGTGPGCVVGAVPEPTSFSMGLLGLLAVAVFGVGARRGQLHVVPRENSV